MDTVIDRLFLGASSVAAATAASWGVTATLAASKATDWSSAGGYVFNGGASSIKIDSDAINTGAGSDHVYGQLAVLLPQLSASSGVVTSFFAYASGEPGGTSTANFNYVYGFGPFGALQPWTADVASRPTFGIDADTIIGGAGNNVIFGEIGDDTITIKGKGTDEISGGWGFNTITGGAGVNYVAFNRATDTFISGGGANIAESALNDGAGSAMLLVSWPSSSTPTFGSVLATGMLAAPIVDNQKPTLVVTPPVIFENTSPPAPSATGGGASYFAATSISPLDPDAPTLSLTGASKTSLGALLSAALPAPIIGFVAAATYASSGEDEADAFDGTALADDAGLDIIGPLFEAAAIAPTLPGAVEQVAWSAAPSGAANAASGIAGVRPAATPDDVIRAIRESEIVIKVSDLAGVTAASARTWLFDEAQGAFVERDPERLTIVVDGGAEATPKSAHAFGSIETAAATASPSSWPGTLRQLGRAAASKWFDV